MSSIGPESGHKSAFGGDDHRRRDEQVGSRGEDVPLGAVALRRPKD
jgi:hypothetical protein